MINDRIIGIKYIRKTPYYPINYCKCDRVHYDYTGRRISEYMNNYFKQDMLHAYIKPRLGNGYIIKIRYRREIICDG